MSNKISEYFANDPPSFFDELANKPKSKDLPAEGGSSSSNTSSGTNMMSNTFTGFFQPPEFVETPETGEDAIKVTDEVRNLWELPRESESGKLIMPGIHLQNDLVSNSHRTSLDYLSICLPFTTPG